MLVTKDRKKARMLQRSRFLSRKRPCFRLLYCGCECANYTSSVILLFGRAVEELMRPNSNGAAFNGISFLFVPRFASLRAAALALLLVGLTVHPDRAHAAPTKTTAHVILMRGVLNIFSLGMDQIAAKLQRQGIAASVHNHMLWASVADDVAAEYKSGRINTVILVGHSSGATVLPDIVARLDQQGVPVKLAIGLDSVFRTSLAGRVGRYVNFYLANGAGKPVQRTAGLQGTLENVDVETVPGVSHLTIDKNEIIQQKVIAAIDAVVFNGPRRSPVADAPAAGPARQVAASARRGAAAAAAAPY
jgi:hypothetical protein